MIIIQNLGKFYGKKTLFEGINLSINRNEKIGLIGPNGAGKSTFFSMLIGENEPSYGTIQFIKNSRIGYLPQESHFHSNRTVIAELIEGDHAIAKLKQEKEKLEIEHKAGIDRYGQILHELEAIGYFDLEHKAKKVLSGLGFKECDFNRSITCLSGGWQMRVLLARLLVCSYDVLLLDEPTNYLDLNAAIWLKDYLSDYTGTFIIISHDRDFLDDVTNHTLVLDRNTITKISGNYEQYYAIRAQYREYCLRQFKEQEKKRKQLEEFVARFHAQPNKASQVRAKRKILERMEEIIVPPDARESIADFKFPPTNRSGYQVIRLQKAAKSYGELKVYANLDFEIIRGEKAVLVGENGAGKSTLLKMLAGAVELDSGVRILGHNAEMGYFSQTRMDILQAHRTVLEEACSTAGQTLNAEQVRAILGAFFFTGDDAHKTVSVLSGGEKSRLILAKLLINPPNLLLLDEPTTHLDVDAVEALIMALKIYQGTIVFISHDIHFVRSVANMVYEVKDNKIRKFCGNFDYYRQKSLELNKNTELFDQPILSDEKQAIPIKKDQLITEKKELAGSENFILSKKIKKLRKQREKIESELFVKEKIVENSRHGRQIIDEYTRQVQELKDKILSIDVEIRRLKQFFIQ